MAVFLSLLRGINVSGQKKILMKDLRSLYEELNFRNIATYVQSGNVVFESKSMKDLAKRIEAKIFEKYNFNVPVIIRTPAEIQAALDKNPFLKKHDADKLYISFLAGNPDRELVNKIKDLNDESCRFIISDKEIYLYCPDGYGKTRLSNNFFENKLKVTATTRNLKTVNELLKITQSLQ